MLRERGLRLTPQRQLILEAVHELGHATPESVHHHVRERAAGANITTVYRTLELLEEPGLVNHTHLSHGSSPSPAPERAAGVNLTPVSRTLELLEELGLVNHPHLSHGSPTYHAAGQDQHVHLVCRSRGSIAEVDPSVMQPVTDRLRDERGFRVDVGHVSLFGVCGNCKEG